MRNVVLLAMLVVAGCSEPDPRARTAPDYVARLEPLLYENGFLASEVQARGLVVGDPLVRSVRLPQGYASAAIEGDRLVLLPGHVD